MHTLEALILTTQLRQMKITLMHYYTHVSCLETIRATILKRALELSQADYSHIKLAVESISATHLHNPFAVHCVCALTPPLWTQQTQHGNFSVSA